MKTWQIRDWLSTECCGNAGAVQVLTDYTDDVVCDGDKARVWWENDGSIDGVIEYTPQDVGDSWVLIEDDGSIVHVNLFYGMRVMSRKADIANIPICVKTSGVTP